LFHEELEGSTISNSKEIFEHTHCFYQRPELLPDDPSTTNTYSQFFAGKRKPIFTSANASNHLISLAEEQTIIENFVAGLNKVRRALRL